MERHWQPYFSIEPCYFVWVSTHRCEHISRLLFLRYYFPSLDYVLIRFRYVFAYWTAARRSSAEPYGLIFHRSWKIPTRRHPSNASLILRISFLHSWSGSIWYGTRERIITASLSRPSRREVKPFSKYYHGCFVSTIYFEQAQNLGIGPSEPRWKGPIIPLQVFVLE